MKKPIIDVSNSKVFADILEHANLHKQRIKQQYWYNPVYTTNYPIQWSSTSAVSTSTNKASQLITVDNDFVAYDTVVGLLKLAISEARAEILEQLFPEIEKRVRLTRSMKYDVAVPPEHDPLRSPKRFRVLRERPGELLETPGDINGSRQAAVRDDADRESEGHSQDELGEPHHG